MKPDLSLKNLLKTPLSLDLIWLIFPASIVAMGMAFMPLRSWDYWWHLACGRLINQTHRIPDVAHFLYTMPVDTPSFVQPWAAQWILFILHENLSLSGMLVFRNAIAACAFLCLTVWSAKRARSSLIGSLLTISVIPFGFFIIALRSHLLAWPLIFVALAIAYRVKQEKTSLWTLCFLPVLTLVWANLHGSFLIPVLVSLSFFADTILTFFFRKDRFKKKNFWGFGIATLFSFIATCLNPRGLDIYAYLSDLSTNSVITNTVSEWFPTTLFYPVFYGPLFWVLLIASLILFWQGRTRLEFVDAILLIGFAALAIQACRGLMWFFLVFPITVSPYLRELFRERREEVVTPFMSNVNLCIILGLVLCALLIQPFGEFQRGIIADVQVMPVRKKIELRGAVEEGFPFEMVSEIKNIDPDARIFHDHRYGGYLIFALQDVSPKQTVFVDSRIELPSKQIWARLDETSFGLRVDETLDRYDVRFVLVRKESQAGLFKQLNSNSGWKKTKEDAFNALFERR